MNSNITKFESNPTIPLADRMRWKQRQDAAKRKKARRLSGPGGLYANLVKSV